MTYALAILDFNGVSGQSTKQFNNLFQSFFHTDFLFSRDPPNPAASQDPRSSSHRGCDKRGREFVYQPTHSCDSVGKTDFNRAIRTIFDGSQEKAVAAYLGDPEAEIPPDEPSRLSSLIGQARQKEKLS